MESALSSFFQSTPLIALLGIIAVAVFVLGKGADLLVDEAVALSKRLGVPSVIIGATIVSLGTTLPEAAVSVLAAVRGNPDLALGNSVGSIICDTGLILGLAAMISPLPLQRSVVNRQGWLQLGAGILLVLLCFPWLNPSAALTTGGTLSQLEGFILVGLLVVYIFTSIKWVNHDGDPAVLPDEALEGHVPAEKASNLKILGQLVMGLARVLVAS
ncbi:MAG: sodium:calcium antiporter, partial [Opitutales bacterium]